MPGRVLVVDDEPGLRFFQRITLEESGIEVDEAASGAEALERCAAGGPFAVIVLDYRMPGITGLDVARRLREAGDETPIVLYSGYVDPRVAEETLALGLPAVIDKADTERLVAMVTAYAGPAAVA
jgi:two-component system response regulator (stage 0 sporulation protein F)